MAEANPAWPAPVSTDITYPNKKNARKSKWEGGVEGWRYRKFYKRLKPQRSGVVVVFQ